MAGQDPPDLIIADYMMPAMDGIALIAAIRADETLHGTPIILPTAIAEAQMRRKTTAYDAYVAKPVQDALLLSAANRLLDPKG